MASMADMTTALNLAKTRLNRHPGDNSIDVILMAYLEAAEADLDGNGIHLTSSMDDLLLLVDTAVWRYQSRDNPDEMPKWLRLRRRERWLREGRCT